MNKLIKENENFALYRPKHSWDMNYHLIEKSTGNDYLIDIDDVVDIKSVLDGYEEYAIIWEDLITLDNIDDCIASSWKTVKKESIY